MYRTAALEIQIGPCILRVCVYIRTEVYAFIPDLAWMSRIAQKNKTKKNYYFFGI